MFYIISYFLQQHIVPSATVAICINMYYVARLKHVARLIINVFVDTISICISWDTRA